MEKIITDTHILYGENLEVISGYSIWIKNDMIYKIVPKKKIPENIPCISGQGAYLIPGLVDLHVHLMWDGSLNPVETHEKESHDQMVMRAGYNSQKYLSNGITTIRDVGSIDDIALETARGIKRGICEGPNLIACGKTLTMTGGHDPFWARFLDGPLEALKATREQIYKGASVIKVSATGGVYGRMEGESVQNSELNYEELKVICDTAHQFGLKVASHAIGREGILNSIKAGVDTIEHGHFLDEELINMMEDKNIAWIPTLYTYKQNAYAKGIPEYAQLKAKGIVEIHSEVFKKYFSRNILIGCGTDAGAPLVKHPSIIDELLQMYKIYPNSKEVLKTATVNAGKILSLPIGKIEEGYKADMILIKENPLNNLHALYGIDTVYHRGKQINR
ncbi:metal-dependent hydrolase family protein [Virgibacillus alimentarius]|uniref:Imidazolonepropionase-like amidohydrolase n=1 Tax=Virgibacillus alimentarius TaxID=698769 RepID=A0ABS4SDT4_9BACI|nr:amidohydrolase family protein [Virgibacillus alimentarius]MBP2259160.1 imidazolonepropionase-like amidohydrolase [Virgibacillus alimentarius]